jgi:hypothetical protein
MSSGANGTLPSPNDKNTANKALNEHVVTPVHIDTMALFSASQRANKGRKRHKSRGLTASIYLSDNIDNGRQIGSLIQTISIKQGPVILRSVPTNRAEHLRPILEKTIPARTPVFSDEQYTWYYNPNHRMINHSAKSKDGRYKFARNRWSKNGVHCQVAEGTQSAVKTAMRNYRYFKPRFSQLYLNEWCLFHNLKYYGEKALRPVDSSPGKITTSGSCELPDLEGKGDDISVGKMGKFS